MSPGASEQAATKTGLRYRLHEVIFEADTPAGKAFDVALIVSIILSVVVVMLESMATVREEYGRLLYGLEWFFTALFTIEYVVRLYAVGSPRAYATSFFGVVDLLAVVPTYLSLLIPGTQQLVAVRALRLLRIFRVFKLATYLEEAAVILMALRASTKKLLVFILAVVTLVIFLGSLMYVIEGEENGFTSVPRSVYWAVVTLTTVGYGDIAPRTPLGQVVSVVVMLLGYAIIAVPTGIVTAELSQSSRQRVSTQSCPNCGRDGHASDAVYCRYCGTPL